MNTCLYGDCRETMKHLISEGVKVQMCVTSPPYWGLRDYGHPDQLGLERTPEAYVANMVEVFRLVKELLKDDGTLWLNLGDSYWGGKGQSGQAWSTEHTDRDTLQKPHHQISGMKETRPTDGKHETIKPKDLVGIPWRVAFALQADGWYLRSDIIWCLSGGTWVYARTQKGDMPMMVRDMARLNPETVQFWNGEAWTQALGWSKSPRKGDEIEFLLRSGERISCTPNHKFPTSRGLLEAKEIIVGDVLESVRIPEPSRPKDSAHIGLDAAWFAGLYIAEGSKSNDCIQIAGHSKESERWNRLNKIAESYGGYITRTVNGNKMDIRLYGKVLNAILDELVTGKTAKDKGLSPVCWKYSNAFLQSMLDGYLAGDGHWDEGNKRWRVGFTRNYNLERDIRTLSARLGFNLTLNLSNSFIGKKKYPSFRGEIRYEFTAEGHWNQKNKAEIVKIGKARCREVYDIGVKDEPHLFALASGILTHNSKPNPMPESVTDRPTKAHEYLFLLSKNSKYYFDQEAVKEGSITNDPRRPYGSQGSWELDGRPTDQRPNGKVRSPAGWKTGKGSHGSIHTDGRELEVTYFEDTFTSRNIRSVWTIPTQPTPEAHFATFPEALIVPCIKAGTSEKGCCPKCGSPWERITKADRVNAIARADRQVATGGAITGGVGKNFPDTTIQTIGWQPTCKCGIATTVPCTVLDPFFGSGTTGKVCIKLARKYIGCELQEAYRPIIQKRTAQGGLFT